MAAAPARRVVAACSFCLKPNAEVAKLVAGPGVYICDECVALCAQIIEMTEGTEPSVNPLRAWETADSLEQVTAILPSIVRAGAQVEENLVGWVHRGRELGASWAQIGEALGVTRQAAWERFAGEGA